MTYYSALLGASRRLAFICSELAAIASSGVGAARTGVPACVTQRTEAGPGAGAECRHAALIAFSTICDGVTHLRGQGADMQSLETRSRSGIPAFAAVATSELSLRPRRASDFESESRALAEVAEIFGAARGSILQKLTDVALDLCKAHSAGITLLEAGPAEPVLRWRALAGKLAPHVGATLPRSFSPCGTTLDSDALQFMSRPVQHYPYLDAWSPAIEEALLIPFRLNGKAAGTMWVVAHDDTRRFDAEDARLLTGLSKFAAVACELLAGFRALDDNSAAGGGAARPIAAAARKDRFVAILGHELRGRLQPAKNAADILKRETLDAPTRRSLAEIIDRQIAGMTRLVDDLLDVARQRAGMFRLRLARANVAEIVEHAVDTVRPLIATRNHTLVVSLPSEPVFLDADAVWLSQALQNLLANAAKYTNPGGTIRISATRENDEAVLTVSDSGVGIAAADLERIFELYSQAGQAGTERSAGGIGIGLYLCRLVIDAHGGVIRAFSAGPGGGSEFTVRVPLPTS
jgi:signal transduction histidine kinase